LKAVDRFIEGQGKTQKILVIIFPTQGFGGTQGANFVEESMEIGAGLKKLCVKRGHLKNACKIWIKGVSLLLKIIGVSLVNTLHTVI